MVREIELGEAGASSCRSVPHGIHLIYLYKYYLAVPLCPTYHPIVPHSFHHLVIFRLFHLVVSRSLSLSAYTQIPSQTKSPKMQFKNILFSIIASAALINAVAIPADKTPTTLDPTADPAVSSRSSYRHRTIADSPST